MALSKSVVKAPDFISCQLCELETKLRWKCLPCDLLMCDNCHDKIHPKFQNAKNHRIIDIKEVGLFTEQNKNIDLTNITCKLHPDQACCIFCTTCDKPVCVTCIAKTHSKHEFIEIKEVYQMKLERLQKGQKKIANDKAMVLKGTKDMAESQTIQDSMNTKALQDIQDQRKALVNKVDQYIGKLTKEVEQNIKTVHDSFYKEKTKVDKIIHTLEEQNRKAEDIVKSKDASKFFDVVDDLVNYMEKAIPPINIANNSTIKFVPGGISLSNVGSLQIDTSPNIIELKVVKEFMTEVNSVSRLLSQDEDSLWIADYCNDIFQKVIPEHTLNTILTFNTPVFDMSVTAYNDVILSSEENALKLINTHTGTPTNSLYSVKPLITSAVHVTNDYNIITGAMTPCLNIFPVNGRRVVMVMDKNGEHQMVYEHDRDNKPLFTYPQSITSTRNGNIAVVDVVSDDGQGRLVILRDRGDVIDIYTGHPEINNKDKPFTPESVVTTPADNIIVTDAINSLLHILDCDGQIITYIDTLDKGIEYPFSLAYTTTGQFYIGCYLPAGSSEEAKLYKVVLSGC